MLCSHRQAMLGVPRGATINPTQHNNRLFNPHSSRGRSQGPSCEDSKKRQKKNGKILQNEVQSMRHQLRPSCRHRILLRLSRVWRAKRRTCTVSLPRMQQPFCARRRGLRAECGGGNHMGLTAIDSYELFRGFLREQRCEAAFERAFYAYNHATTFDRAMWEASPDKASFIGHAFRWDNTPEGRNFWNAMDKKWNYVLRRF